MRIKLTLSYDGLWFKGWAIQPNMATVQGVIEEVLSTIAASPIHTTVAGRTDAGVHARAQVIHFDLTDTQWLQFVADYENSTAAFIRRVSSLLPVVTVRVTGAQAAKGAICLKNVEVVPETFDARFSAVWRRYSYTIEDRIAHWDPLTRNHVLQYPQYLDINILNEAAAFMLGKHDFLAFCKPRPSATTIRALEIMQWKRQPEGLVKVDIQADAFCHHMVRALVGASLLVGTGEKSPQWLKQRLKNRVRNSEANLAPPHALVLEEVGYPHSYNFSSRTVYTRQRRV